MTLVIGTKENAHFAQKAFSLIEIVLVLALIALATSAVILNFDSFMGKDASPSTRESLSEAIRYARIQATKKQSLTEIYFDQEQGALVVALSSNTLKTFHSHRSQFSVNWQWIDKLLFDSTGRGSEAVSKCAQ